MSNEEIIKLIKEINNKREKIVSKMKEMNINFSHKNPGVNVNTTLSYKELCKELLELDTQVINLKEEIQL